ncbi:DUF4097 family beta strand repeat protein [bacterium]|nr:DUF4097 family beta strand repeat protein [bacterium]
MNRLRFITVLLLLSALPMTVAPQELKQEDGVYKTVIRKTFDVKPGGKLIVETSGADVQVGATASNQVEVRESLSLDVFTEEEAKKAVEKELKTYSFSDNTVRIVTGSGKNWMDRDFEIAVPKQFNVEVKTSGGDISVEGAGGSVVLAASGGDIEVSRVTGSVEISTSGGDLELKEITGNLQAETSGGDIALHNIRGDAEVATSGGDLSLNQIRGKIEAATSGGDIEINDCEGASVEIATSGGDIELSRIAGPLEAATSGGDISGREFGDRIEVATSGGDISLEEVGGAAEVATSGGDITIVMAKKLRKPHDLDIATSGGDIRLSLPADIKASVTAEIELREKKGLDRNDVYSDFPLTKKELEVDGDKVIRCTGDINGGGDSILLKTRGGDIHITKIK